MVEKMQSLKKEDFFFCFLNLYTPVICTVGGLNMEHLECISFSLEIKMRSLKKGYKIIFRKNQINWRASASLSCLTIQVPPCTYIIKCDNIN